MTQVRIPRRPVDGVFLLDKPLHLSSNTALQRVRWLYRAQKAGHTGVLDPLATGLLPVCLGEATKFSAFLLDADKGYCATVRFGAVSTTLDAEGEITPVGPVNFDADRLREVLDGFLGEIEQVPPMHSALKFQGKALYEYAREGIEIERKVRRITIHSIELAGFDGDTAVINVQCSKGTYVRTLAADIGAVLGCGAYLTGLRRTRTAGFEVADALTLDALEAVAEDARDGLLMPPDVLVAHLPRTVLDDADIHRLCHGQPALAAQNTVRAGENDAIIRDFRLYTEDGRFIGLGEIRKDDLLWPNRMLANKPVSA